MADIFRTIKNKNYTVMSNHHLQNPNLSLKAMGLMSKILSLPEDWNYSVKGLAAYCKDGYESVRTALLELEAEGYLIRRTIRGERGKIAGTEYIFRETPDMEVPESGRASESQKTRLDQTVFGEPKQAIEKGVEEEKKQTETPKSDFPITGKKEVKSPGLENPIPVKKAQKEVPESDFPSTGNRDQQNTNKQNNNIYTSSSSNEENNIYSNRGEWGKRTPKKSKVRSAMKHYAGNMGTLYPMKS